jgi:hypothetical protein
MQGMNDILAPIFAVFLADQFGMSFAELEANFTRLESRLESFDLLEVP